MKIEIPANQSVPFSVTIHRQNITESDWRIVRQVCVKQGCKKWPIEDGGPVWPIDCSDECRAYTLLKAFNHGADTKSNRWDGTK